MPTDERPSRGSRSRSPHRSSRSEKGRHRPKSPHHSHHRHKKSGPSTITPTKPLPFDARHISKHDLPHFRPMFGLYLDIQKQLDLEEMAEEEVKGRWKSLVGKWNRGELAEGWYDSQTLEKVRLNAAIEEPLSRSKPRRSPDYGNVHSEDDEYGPVLPSGALTEDRPESSGPRSGPSLPHVQDLQYKREIAAEDAADARRTRIESARNERRAERNVQKERLDEIAPRAEAGTRERQLEKKREKADSNHAFAASAHDNAGLEVKDSDLMGDGGGIDELKKMKQVQERKRSEREVRREENLASRRAATEERVKAMQEKEQKTMFMLKELARARFGGRE